MESREFLQYFKESMQSVPTAAGNMLGRGKASCPMAVVFLGKETADALADGLKEELFRLWPAYRNAFFFLCAEEEGGETPCYSEIGKGRLADVPALRERVTELFQDGPFFTDYRQLFVFYVLDTTAGVQQDDPEIYADLIRKTAAALGHNNQCAMLGLTLDDGIGREQQAVAWRNWLADQSFGNGPWKQETACTVLVSNKSSVGSSMGRNRSAAYFSRIFAGVIVLANAAGESEKDRYVRSALRRPGIRAAGYEVVQKPSGEIAKVSFSELVQQIDRAYGAAQTVEEIANLEDRLALHSQMDAYLAAAQAMLPAPEQLNAFPRRSFEERDLYSLSAQELDAETFGAWSGYLSGIEAGIEKKILADVETEGSFQERFLDHLKQKFSRTELLWLTRHGELVDDLLQKETHRDVCGGARASFRADLCSRLFRNAGVQDSIRSAVRDAGEQARNFMQIWEELLEQNFLYEDETVVALYRQRVTGYMDRHQAEIKQEFHNLVSESQLETFLKKHIRGLIQSDPLYRTSFEEEFMTRLGERNPAQALKQIAAKVTGEAVHIWLPGYGSIYDETLLQVLFVKAGSELEDSLKKGLDSDSYHYYDNDSNEEASALNLYELDKDQLRV